jgi:hypothetical protein
VLSVLNQGLRALDMDDGPDEAAALEQRLLPPATGIPLVGRKSISGGVSPKGQAGHSYRDGDNRNRPQAAAAPKNNALNRIQLDFEFEGLRYRPTIDSKPTPANLLRARRRLADIKERIARGCFNFEEEFPDFRFIEKIVNTAGPLTCNEVFDAFLKHCEARVARRDLAFVIYNGYRKLLAQIWRPEIGADLFRMSGTPGWPKSLMHTRIGRRKPTTMYQHDTMRVRLRISRSSREA